MRLLLLLPIICSLSGCAAQQLNAYKKALAEPVDVWKQKVEIRDDPLETVVTYSTQPAIHDLKNVFTGESMDAFIRGSKDKATGLATVHGYIHISMRNQSWPQPYQINHGKPLRTHDVNDIGRDVDCSGSDVMGGCTYEYHLTFPIPMSEFKRLAEANYSLDEMQAIIWKFRLKFRAYEDFNHGLPVQEMLSIYEVMTEDGAFFTE